MGVFRTRDRFNVQADGYWIKGRCVLPGSLMTKTGYEAWFGDIGTIVKHRKGKRRPVKVKANVKLGYRFYVEFGGTIREVGSFDASYSNESIIRNKFGSIRFDEELIEGTQITGMKVEILSWQGDSGPVTTIHCTVGETP